MPMIKNYTLSYLFNIYRSDQSNNLKFDFESGGENKMSDDLSLISFSPSEKSVQVVLNFSRAYDVLNSKFTGSIEVIKN